MDELARRWFMVVRLVDGWRWFSNLGPTMGGRATLHWANAGLPKLALRRADEQNYVGPTPFFMLGQHERTTMGRRWPT